MLKSLFRTAGIYTASSALGGVIPFLLVPVLTRHMEPTEYGIAAMFVTATAFGGVLTGLSVHGAVTVRYFEPEKFSPYTYVGSCVWILVASTVAVVLLTLLLGNSLVTHLGLPVSWLVVAILASGFMFVINIRLVLWQVTFAAGRYAALQLSMTALHGSLAILLVVAFAAGWQGRAGAQAIATVSIGLFALWSLYRAGYLHRRPDSAAIRDALAFGLPLVPHALGGLLISMSDRLVVATKMGLDDAGIYSAGAQVGLVMALLTDAFNRAYSPWLFAQLRDADAERKSRLVRLTYLYVGTLFLGVGAYALLSPWLFELLVGDAYAQAREVSIWVALGGAFQGLYYMVGLYINYVSRNVYLAGITICVGLINVPMTMMLVEEHGAVGAAYAYALTQALFAVLAFLLSRRSYPMPWFGKLQ
jgi:O-antigen/teichoic acid export membrane protein